MDHSPQGSILWTGWFFGSKGICYGFYDGGDFFKDPKIKYQIENKIEFEKFDNNSRGMGGNENSGFNNHIYPYSNFIEVDSDNGILYCVQMKENIIAPEGENGSIYFDRLRRERGIIKD